MRNLLLLLLFVALSLLPANGQDQAAAQPGYFSKNLYPILQKANCRTCHVVDGVASATRIHFPDEDAPAGRIEAFGKSLVALVDQSHPEESLLLKKPTLRIPHTGGKRIPPGTEEEKVLLSWIGYLARLSPAETAAVLKGGRPEVVQADRLPVLRRLTHSQYNHTVFDLLGEESNPADQFPPEDFVNGYKGQYQAQSVGPLLAEAYSSAAEKLARNAFRGGDARGLVPCKPKSPADAACRVKFIRTFGQKAFRRPLLETEVSRYSALFAQEAARNRDFLRGAQAVVEALLQSPKFLFRVENGTDPKWRGYETAGRLAYFLWDSMPDEALFRSAAAGELDTPAGLDRAARRLLADPKAKRSLDQFTSEWMRFDRALGAVKDRRLFPQFSPELAVAMTEETRRLIADAVWNDRNFLDIFTADYAFLNGDLASIYGLPAPPGDFERVSLPAASDRAGVIGEGTFLLLTSKPAETSPTARGLFVREQFLCQHVPDPPPGVNTNLPPFNGSNPQTNRDRLKTHLVMETCSSCHNLIDPIGLGLEKYDAVGRKQEKLKLTFFPGRLDDKSVKTKTVELPLDTSGHIAGIQNSDFSSPKELGSILASSAQCQECLVKQLFRYEAGRVETPADREIIQRSFQTFRDSQFRFKELMIGLLKWTVFPDGKTQDLKGPTTE